ncbi:hypothetical protein M422DRAFT_105209, partial [Sphaerobolus stellatus SS14]
SHHDATQVFYTISCMLAFSRSERSSNASLVFGLFLLGSGAKKNLIDVLAHAGFCVSYSSIMRHVKALSHESLEHCKALVRQQMCSICWDNVNLAF